MKNTILILAALLAADRAFPCAACQDRDVFKDAFVAKTNAAAEAAAAAQAAEPTAGTPVAAPQAPRERTTAGGPSTGGFVSEELPTKKPLRIRSFNELK